MFRLSKKCGPIYGRFAGTSLAFTLLLISFSGCDNDSDVTQQTIEVEPDGRMNCLVIVLDSFHASKSSLYGFPKATTPHLEKWAAKGVVFEQATSQYTQTSGSAWSYLNGQYPYQLNPFLPIQEDDVPLAQLFQDAGYRTAGLSDNPYISEKFSHDRGYDDFQYHRFDEIRFHKTLNSMPSTSNEAGIGRDEISKFLFDQLQKWITIGGEQPWFGYVHSLRPHTPYTTVEPYRSTFLDDAGPWSKATSRQDFLDFENALVDAYVKDRTMATEAELAILHQLYLANILYIDELLGSLLTEMESNGQLDNTLVIITSDHGEAFGEHGEMMHAGNPHREQIHVPLIMIMPPSMKYEPGRIGARVELVDLLPTLTEIFDLNDSVQRHGQSLTGLLSREAEVLDGVDFAQSKKAVAVVSDGMKLLMNMSELESENAPSARLYDLKRDPEETTNLYPNHESLEELLGMLRTYVTALKNQGSIVEPELTEDEIDTLEALGYLDEAEQLRRKKKKNSADAVSEPE